MSLLGALRHRRRFARMLEAHTQVHLVRAGLELGLFEALRQPHAPQALAERLGLAGDLVTAWLHAAHAQRLLRFDGEHYRLDAYARALLDDDDAEGLHALLAQTAETYGGLLARLPELMKGGERGDFGSPEEAARTAAVSRLVERRAMRALGSVPRVGDARRVLDIGCGFGTYLAGWLARYRDAQGLGIELDPHVAEEARRRLRESEVTRRGEVMVGDFLEMELPQGTFDLVWLNNNLHYFAPADHHALFRRVREKVTPGGVFAIQTPVVAVNRISQAIGTASGTAILDLVLRGHANLHGLPDLATLEEELLGAGFSKTGRVDVLPGGTAAYLWAR